MNDSLHHGQLQEQFSKMLGISSSRVIWEASGNCCGRGTQVITTVFRKLRDTAAKTMLFSFQVNIRIHGVSQDAIYKDDERMSKTQDISG